MPPSFLSRQIQSLGAVFRPPFNGLAAAVWLYFAWCFLVHPHSQILRGNLPDPDDYMYLDQVLDWIRGQGWFDNVQHRLDPPDGAPIHFSRLTQIPMAALVLLFQALGFGPRGAATLMAIVQPLILFLGFFAAVRWSAKAFMPKDWAGVTAYVTLFSTGLLFQFSPGHVDHHGLVTTLVVLAAGGAARMMQEPGEFRWNLLTGFALALALTVALETLPWLVIASAWLGLWAMVRGGAAARSGLVYALTLHLASIALLAVTRPPSAFFEFSVPTYSIVYVFLTGGITVSFAGMALAAGARPELRGLAGIGPAAVTGFLFLRLFPDLAGGPWAGVEPTLGKLLLDHMYEAQPLGKILEHSWFRIAVYTAGPWLALGAGLCLLRRMPARRWELGLMTTLLAVAILLTIIYQYRFVGIMGAFAILPLSMMLQRGWGWIGDRWRGRGRVYAEIGLLLLVGPLPAVLLPAIVNGTKFNTGVLLFPAANNKPGFCDMYRLERVLRSSPLYDGKPRLIANVMGTGPELLFRTPHMALSAPYHMDVNGNLDSVRFFSATDPAEAEAIARRRHIDLVVTCFMIPSMYAKNPLDEPTPKVDGKPAPRFIQQLVAGRVPAWLKRVQAPGLRNYVVYEVRLPPGDGKPARRK